jgi:hypothetical protein
MVAVDVVGVGGLAPCKFAVLVVVVAPCKFAVLVVVVVGKGKRA